MTEEQATAVLGSIYVTEPVHLVFDALVGYEQLPAPGAVASMSATDLPDDDSAKLRGFLLCLRRLESALEVKIPNAEWAAHMAERDAIVERS